MADEVCLLATLDMSPPPQCPQSAVSLTDVVHHPSVPVTDDHDLSVPQIPLVHEFDDGSLVVETSLGKLFTRATCMH